MCRILDMRRLDQCRTRWNQSVSLLVVLFSTACFDESYSVKKVIFFLPEMFPIRRTIYCFIWKWIVMVPFICQNSVSMILLTERCIRNFFLTESRCIPTCDVLSFIFFTRGVYCCTWKSIVMAPFICPNAAPECFFYRSVVVFLLDSGSF